MQEARQQVEVDRSILRPEATGSSRLGGGGSQQVQCITTPLREGGVVAEGLMGGRDDWVAGVAED